MKHNMGTTDRIIRAFVIAPVLLLIAFLVGFGSVGGIVATVLAIVMVGTAAVGVCPLYAPFHVRTDHHPS